MDTEGETINEMLAISQAYANQAPEGTAHEAPAEAYHVFAAESVYFYFGSIDWSTVNLAEATQIPGFCQMIDRIPGYPLAQEPRRFEKTMKQPSNLTMQSLW